MTRVPLSASWFLVPLDVEISPEQLEEERPAVASLDAGGHSCAADASWAR